LTLIRTPEEMERFFGAPPLTTIPYVGAFEQNSQRHTSKRKWFWNKASQRSMKYGNSKSRKASEHTGGSKRGQKDRRAS